MTSRIAIGVTVLALTAFAPAAFADEPTSVTFPSADGVVITADLYIAHDKAAPLVVLFHQAGWSRGEYREIAPRLNKLGLNCIAVDQRSGGAVNGVTNQTHKRASRARKPTSYLHALPDLRAALLYARKHHARGKLIAWGSSYSSALVLRLAGTEPKLADGWIAFAPGEYFKKFGKSGTFIRSAARNIKEPVFITSARSEKKNWASIYDAIPGNSKTSYLPTTRGNHGSRALWKKFKDSEGYWTAVEAFLRAHALPSTR